MKSILLLIVGIALAAAACGTMQSRTASEPVKTPAVQTKPELVVGGIYSIDDGEGGFGVVKILALDNESVHVRVYKNRYQERPETVELGSLTMGTLDDPGGYGIGHLPLERAMFWDWNPMLAAKDQVREDELYGYEIWKEATHPE